MKRPERANSPLNTSKGKGSGRGKRMASRTENSSSANPISNSGLMADSGAPPAFASILPTVAATSSVYSSGYQVSRSFLEGRRPVDSQNAAGGHRSTWLPSKDSGSSSRKQHGISASLQLRCDRAGKALPLPKQGGCGECPFDRLASSTLPSIRLPSKDSGSSSRKQHGISASLQLRSDRASGINSNRRKRRYFQGRMLSRGALRPRGAQLRVNRAEGWVASSLRAGGGSLTRESEKTPRG